MRSHANHTRSTLYPFICIMFVYLAHFSLSLSLLTFFVYPVVKQNTAEKTQRLIALAVNEHVHFVGNVVKSRMPFTVINKQETNTDVHFFCCCCFITSARLIRLFLIDSLQIRFEKYSSCIHLKAGVSQDLFKKKILFSLNGMRVVLLDPRHRFPALVLE